MQPFRVGDRRISNLRHWDLVVEVGVNYFRTVGTARAITFLRTNGVSEDVINRVTSSRPDRRKTNWELQFDEQALRQALGARPLLPEHQHSLLLWQHQPRELVHPHSRARGASQSYVQDATTINASNPKDMPAIQF